jgi:hypothetical protein
MENRKISSNGWKAIESSQNPSIIAAYSAYKDSQEKDLENLGPQYYSQAVEGHFDYSSESTNALLDILLELCEEEGLRIYESFIKKFESFDADEDAERMKEDEIYSSMEEEDEADEIVARFEEEFGDNEPTVQEFAEFYHMLRTEGIDGIKIFNALEGLIPENEEEDEEGQEDQHFEGLKKFFEFNDIQEDEEGFDDFGFESPFCKPCEGTGCEECDGSGMKRNSVVNNDYKDRSMHNPYYGEEEDDELLAYDADTDADQMEEDEAQYERKSLKRFNDFK